MIGFAITFTCSLLFERQIHVGWENHDRFLESFWHSFPDSGTDLGVSEVRGFWTQQNRDLVRDFLFPGSSMNETVTQVCDSRGFSSFHWYPIPDSKWWWHISKWWSRWTHLMFVRKWWIAIKQLFRWGNESINFIRFSHDFPMIFPSEKWGFRCFPMIFRRS
jgi:hypothetical protein